MDFFDESSRGSYVSSRNNMEMEDENNSNRNNKRSFLVPLFFFFSFRFLPQNNMQPSSKSVADDEMYLLLGHVGTDPEKNGGFAAAEEYAIVSIIARKVLYSYFFC